MVKVFIRPFLYFHIHPRHNGHEMREKFHSQKVAKKKKKSSIDRGMEVSFSAAIGIQFVDYCCAGSGEVHKIAASQVSPNRFQV